MKLLPNMLALSLSLVTTLAAAQGMSGPTQAELNASDTSTNNWLMMNKGYSGQRYVALSQINTSNAARLKHLCTFDTKDPGSFQSTPQIYQGVAYIIKGYHTYAINATNCNLIWQSEYKPKDGESSVLETSRGAALYNGMLIRGTGTAHLYALSMKTGKMLWDTKVNDSSLGYFLSSAPIVWNNTVYVGEAGADWGAHAHMYAFNAQTGAKVWSFDMIPTGKQFGANTWKRAASTSTGGGSMWSSYVINPKNGRLYMSVGNPAPDFAPQYRPGDNLFTDSLVVLNATTGKLDHYYQQIANDDKDYDTSSSPVLYSLNGVPHVSVVNKAGTLYTYNERSLRTTYTVPTIKQLNLKTPPNPKGVPICPNYIAGSQWYGATFNPQMRAVITPSVDWCGTVTLGEVRYVQAQLFMGGTMGFAPDKDAIGQVSAFDAASGRRLWHYQEKGIRIVAGVTNTAGNLVMSGDLKGDFFILDARNGRKLFTYNIDKAPIGGGPSTYMVGGQQYIAVPAGNTSRAGTGPAQQTGRVAIFGLK